MGVGVILKVCDGQLSGDRGRWVAGSHFGLRQDGRTEAFPSQSVVIGLASLKTTVLREGTRFYIQCSLLMTVNPPT